jgi:DNA-binding transcriptional MerR regulator
MLKQSEAIKICKDKFNIKISDRNFVFYRNEGFYSVQARENRLGLYDDDVPEKIALIKTLQDQGMKLKNIKMLIQAQDDKKVATKEKIDIEIRMKALKSWEDPEFRRRRCLEVLDLDETGYSVNVGMVGTLYGETVTFLSVFHGGFVDFYRFRVDLKKDKIEFVEQKNLTLDSLDMIMVMVMRSYLAIGKIMDADDLYISIFY